MGATRARLLLSSMRTSLICCLIAGTLAKKASSECFATPYFTEVCLRQYLRGRSCNIVQYFGSYYDKYMGKEWYEIGEKMKAKLDGNSKTYLDINSKLATNSIPVAYAYTEVIGTQERILAILGKKASGENNDPEKGKWGLCKVSGSKDEMCFWTTSPYNAPGRPTY